MALFKGALRSQWDTAKDKVEAVDKGKTLASLGLPKLDFGPNLDELEKAVKNVTTYRANVMNTYTMYRSLAASKNRTDLVTALDSIRDQVNRMVEELGKTAAAAKTD
jgi:hypothetical protein